MKYLYAVLILVSMTVVAYADGYGANGEYIDNNGNVYDSSGGYAGNIDASGNAYNSNSDNIGSINSEVGVYNSQTDISNFFSGNEKKMED